MRTKNFNVIIYDFNHSKFISYDVIPYLVDCYNEEENKPTTFEEFKSFVKNQSMYQWWSRCEYEVILKSWPNDKTQEKIDIHWQVMMNIDIITEILMEEVLK